MKTILNILFVAAFIALIFACSSCTTDYIESSTGSRLYLAQVGGQKRIESITVDGITISGYGVDNEASFRDTTRFASGWVSSHYLFKSFANNNAADVAKSKSTDAVTTTSIQESAATSRLIDTNTTKVNLAELGVE